MHADSLMQATDARLDWAFAAHCRKDVRSLCSAEDLAVLGASASVFLPGIGNSALECLRNKLDFVRDPSCMRYVADARTGNGAVNCTVLMIT